MSSVSPLARREIIDALRRGTVPRRGLDAFAVGLERFETTFDEELGGLRGGRAAFKAVRGEYGSGKTFFARWLAEQARRKGFATSEVQISETETPLHRLETVYRRLVERLATQQVPSGAFRPVLEGWFYALERDALAEGTLSEKDTDGLLRRTDQLLEERLALVARESPVFAAVLRAFRRARAEDERAIAEGLLGWLGGQPHIGAAAKRYAGVKGSVDHFAALSFLQGLLTILRDSGYPGLVLVLDETETLQRVRSDVREKSLNALRQLLDEIDGGRFPGLYLLITGTSAFFDGPMGIQRLPPLAQRLQTDFSSDTRFDNPRAVQVRLKAFDFDALEEVARRIRDLYAEGSSARERIVRLADDQYLRDLARAVAGELGGKVGVSPRVFLKKLVADVLDRIDQFDDFDPRQHYELTIAESELTLEERAGRGATDPDDVELDL